MSRKKREVTVWEQVAAHIIYGAYPDQQLPIEPPGEGETIGSFARRVGNCGDTLFTFICREADEPDLTKEDFRGRLDRAILDLEAVRAAFEDRKWS